ncbi:MAG: YafY family transcriptional regulator [Agarilytica sp.]
MRRADRLFQIVQILRNRRLVTAKALAERLEVSERTIYRDIQDLSLSGVPVEGEAGVGYVLRHSMDIPPLMFSQDEIQSIVLGARMVGTWGGQELAKAAQTAIDKIEGALPEHLRHLTQESHLYAHPYHFETDIFNNVDVLRRAVNDKLKISFEYTREDGNGSERTIKPLALYFWGYVWTLTGWCYLRNSFRNFRIDRMQSIQEGEKYEEVCGESLEDYINSLSQCSGGES